MTLVEILAVVVILGLIAGTLAVSFSGAFGRGKHELAKTQIGLLVGKLEAYRVERGAWPDPSVGLQALSEGHADPTAPYYVGPGKLMDPWGHAQLRGSPG